MLGMEQFTTNQDLNGKITGCDISGIAHRLNCPYLVGQNIQDFCHAKDVQQLFRHLHEVAKHGQSTSAVYRFRMQDNRYSFVQTKSTAFKNKINGSADFIMSTHSVIRECDPESEKDSTSTSLMSSIIGPSLLQNQQPSVSNSANVNSSNVNMGVNVNSNVNMSGLNGLDVASFLGITSDNLSEQDFLSSDWDNSSSFTVSSVTSSANMAVKYTSGNTSHSSASCMNHLRMSQVHQDLQQLQRSLSTSGQPQQRANPASLGSGNTRSSSVSQFANQRSASIDRGQHQGQSQSGIQQMAMSHGQKSPGFSPGTMRSGLFQFPPQRSGVGSYNLRSPGALPSPIDSGFNTPFPQRTPTPMLSPSPDYEEKLELDRERQTLKRQLSQLEDDHNDLRENFHIESRLQKVSSSESDSSGDSRSRSKTRKQSKKKKKSKQVSKSPTKLKLPSPSPGRRGEKNEATRLVSPVKKKKAGRRASPEFERESRVEKVIGSRRQTKSMSQSFEKSSLYADDKKARKAEQKKKKKEAKTLDKSNHNSLDRSRVYESRDRELSPVSDFRSNPPIKRRRKTKRTRTRRMIAIHLV